MQYRDRDVYSSEMSKVELLAVRWFFLLPYLLALPVIVDGTEGR